MESPEERAPLGREELGQAAQELSTTLGRLLRKVRADAADHGLTLSQASLLKRLDREGPETPAALARAELVRPQSVLATVNALQADGLVERRPHPTDGRQVLIVLTARGRERLRRRTELRQDAMARMLADRLTPEEQHALRDSIDLLRRLSED
ncbi:MarR family winged helix-turn-helix transcriptional regulator [Streptomyces sp. NPDC059785]|uniref:MarR family winged helix-turn-helix transcriptional regulator n=1 Tax=unclassified Streptomyces TaxID=2593676 RepID=UPI00364F7E83